VDVNREAVKKIQIIFIQHMTSIMIIVIIWVWQISIPL